MIQKRRFQRVPFFCAVVLKTSPGGLPVACRTMDISLGGVGLATSAGLELGQTVSLSFSLRDAAGRPIVDEVAGRVAHMRAELDGNVVGVEFLELLTQAKHPELMRRALRD